MEVLEIVLPVLAMIILGILCRKWKLLDQSGVNNMKTLVTNIMLPVAIFHALATAEYSGKIGILVLIMFVMLLISFGAGFWMKRFMDEPYKKYLPFLICIYEGGMMAYRCIQVFVAAKIFHRLQCWILRDFFLDSVCIWECWDRRKTGEKINAKSLFYSALRTPAFIGTVLGIIVGLTRMITRLLDSPFGNCYLSVENILTTAITPIILIVVGYSMELAPELISPCLKTILLRVLLQAVMIAGVLMAVKYLVGGSRLLNLAVITYMSSPATFSMQTFLRKKESSAYASTTNSLYCVVSILVYITLAVAG